MDTTKGGVRGERRPKDSLNLRKSLIFKILFNDET
jgi:hypothetical protein